MATKSADGDRLALRPREAARAIGISERTLFSWTASGDGPPCIRRGRVRLYPAAKLAEWLDAQAAEHEAGN